MLGRGDGVVALRNLDDRAGLLELRTLEQCVSDMLGAAEARRSVLAPPRSDAIGRSARALARSINASLRCISGVLSWLFALRRRSCNLIVRVGDTSREDV